MVNKHKLYTLYFLRIILFIITYVYFFVTVEEIINFNQTDLVPEDVMLLDTWDTIFLWIGDFANREERKQAINLAINYLRTGKKW